MIALALVASHLRRFVAARHRIDPDRLKHGWDREVRPARAEFIHLAHDQLGMSAERLAQMLIMSPSTVYREIDDVKCRLTDDPEAQRQMAAIAAAYCLELTRGMR